MIYIDADACPVKDETYKVADRYSVPVCVVANSWMRTPNNDRVTLEVVPGNFDAADDWIADRAGPGDIVVTGDIPLAARCIDAGARVGIIKLHHVGTGPADRPSIQSIISEVLEVKRQKNHGGGNT